MTIPLKDFPEDVRKIVLIEQAKKKIEKKVRQYSMTQTIYGIIREYEKMKTKT